MNVIVYTLMAYVITAVISFGVMGIIVGLNKFMSRTASPDAVPAE